MMRIWLGLNLLVVCCTWCVFVRADDSPATQGTAVQRTTAAAVQPSVNKLTVDTVLKEWYAVNSKVNRVDLKFTYVSYDDIFEVEEHGVGLASVDRDNRGFFKVSGSNIKPGAEGRRYRIRPVTDCRWHVTDEGLIRVDEKGRRFENVTSRMIWREIADVFHPVDRPPPPALPEDLLPTFPSLSQFLIIPRPEKFQRKFEISILKESAQEVRMKFVPKEPNWNSEFAEIHLILKRDTYLPSAIKCFNLGRGRDVVYVATKAECNQPPRAPFGDLRHPDLRGFVEDPR